VIVSALVAIFSITVFMAGALATAYPGVSLMLSIPAGTLLMFIYHLTAPNVDETVNTARDNELTLGQLKESLAGTDDGLVLYHENPFSPIAGWFFARIGGRTVLVMERSHQ